MDSEHREGSKPLGLFDLSVLTMCIFLYSEMNSVHTML